MVLIPNTLELTTIWVTPRPGGRSRGASGPRRSIRISCRSRSTTRAIWSRSDCSRRAIAPGARRPIGRCTSTMNGIGDHVAFEAIRPGERDGDTGGGVRSGRVDVRYRGAVLPRAPRCWRRGGSGSRPRSCGRMIGRRAVEVAGWLKSLAGVEEPPEVILAEVQGAVRGGGGLGRASDARALIALLDHLASLRLPAAVATSSGRSYADRLLTRHGLADRFAFVLASEDVTRGKPDPADLPAGRRAVRRSAPGSCSSWRTARPAWRPGAGPARSPWASRTSTAPPRRSRRPT